MPKKRGKKELGAITLVHKNKPKSERFLCTIYLKRVRSVSSNSV